MSKFKVKVNGEEVEVEVVRQGENFRVSRNGTATAVRLLHHDGTNLIIEQVKEDGMRQRIRAAGQLDGDRRYVWVNGRSFSYQRLRDRQKTVVDSDTSRLSASIPAVVAEILVNVGDTVADGDKLILLESMKMVIPIQAKFPGIVTGINCQAGDAVQPGDPLIHIDELTQ